MTKHRLLLISAAWLSFLCAGCNTQHTVVAARLHDQLESYKVQQTKRIDALNTEFADRFDRLSDEYYEALKQKALDDRDDVAQATADALVIDSDSEMPLAFRRSLKEGVRAGRKGLIEVERQHALARSQYLESYSNLRLKSRELDSVIQAVDRLAKPPSKKDQVFQLVRTIVAAYDELNKEATASKAKSETESEIASESSG